MPKTKVSTHCPALKLKSANGKVVFCSARYDLDKVGSGITEWTLSVMSLIVGVAEVMDSIIAIARFYCV